MRKKLLRQALSKEEEANHRPREKIQPVGSEVSFGHIAYPASKLNSSVRRPVLGIDELA